jgi:hypothetical protein
MSFEHSLQNKSVRLDGCRGAADSVAPLLQDNIFQGGRPPQRGDEFFAILSPLLEEADGLRHDQSREQESGNFLVLLEENARLRKLAIQLSNLLGDLPGPSAVR